MSSARFAFVKSRDSFFRDADERRREVGLLQGVARLIGLAVFRELCFGCRELAYALQCAIERARKTIRQFEAFRRETDRGLHETLPRQASVLLPGHVQTGDGAGDAYREMAQVMPLEAILAVFEPHRVGRFGGCHLAEIERYGLAFSGAKDEKPASSDIARRRVGHGESESGGDRSVNGVSAVLHDVDPNLGG